MAELASLSLPTIAPPVIVDSRESRSNVTARISLTLPEDIYARYDAQGKAAKVSPEKAMADRLRRCVSYVASRPLYFDDAARNELEQITGGHQLDSAESALTRIRNTVSVKVGDVTIVIPRQVLDRAHSRAAAFRIPVEAWLEREILEGLERSTGMRP